MDSEFKEPFKAFMQPSWALDDLGIIYKNDYFVWGEVSNIAVFHDPKSSLTNGVFTIDLRGKRKNLVYAFNDRERAEEEET